MDRPVRPGRFWIDVGVLHSHSLFPGALRYCHGRGCAWRIDHDDLSDPARSQILSDGTLKAAIAMILFLLKPSAARHAEENLSATFESLVTVPKCPDAGLEGHIRQRYRALTWNC